MVVNDIDLEAAEKVVAEFGPDTPGGMAARADVSKSPMANFIRDKEKGTTQS